MPSMPTTVKEMTDMGEGWWLVGSSQKPISYLVRPDEGWCTCHVGQKGGGCKHQDAVSYKHKIFNSRCLPVTPAWKRVLFEMATGKIILLM